MPAPSFAMLAATPDAESLRRKAAEVVARPEFDLSSGVDEETLNLWWRFFLWLLTPIRWFLEAISGVPWPLQFLIIVGLVVLLVLLVAHISWSFLQAVRGPSRRKFLETPEKRPSPDALEATAARLAAEGDFIGGIRCLFKASLVRIETAEEQPFRRGITNREVLKRYRASRLFEPLSRVVDLIDTRWYGLKPCNQTDYLNCEAEYTRIRILVEGRAHAVRP